MPPLASWGGHGPLGPPLNPPLITCSRSRLAGRTRLRPPAPSTLQEFCWHCVSLITHPIGVQAPSWCCILEQQRFTPPGKLSATSAVQFLTGTDKPFMSQCEKKESQAEFQPITRTASNVSVLYYRIIYIARRLHLLPVGLPLLLMLLHVDVVMKKLLLQCTL